MYTKILYKDTVELFDCAKIPDEAYFITGSRALDCPTIKFSSDESDYDFVMRIQYRHILIGYLISKQIKIEYSSYNGGFKFIFNNKLYNIITTINIEFMAWRESLSFLKMLIRKDDIYANALKDKISRYGLYEQLRGFCKIAILLGSK